MGKAGILALIRGYSYIDRYSNLIKSNNHIEEECENLEEYDFLPFHEGNIPVDHQEIDNSKEIYKYRWGDLPLWVEVFHYMVDGSMLLMDKWIKYYHSNHNQQVN